MISRSLLLTGMPVLIALLACGGSSEKVVVESPEPETPVMAPASRPVTTPPPAPATKVKKKTTTPDGTQIETETEYEYDD
jgi:hypothetical protein